MNTDARSRLAAQAAAAGYPPDLLALIAHATLPAYQPGAQLEDAQIAQITDAVEVLAQAGYRADTLAEHIAEYQRRHGGDWRERFWARALRIASVRYRRPEPTGSRPARPTHNRLAEHAARQPASPRRGPPEPTFHQSKEIEMTDLALAPADAPASTRGPTTAAELAARIPCRASSRPAPRRRADPTPVELLLQPVVVCKEAWRRKYLHEREPTSGAMFLGSRVDDALSLYYRRILDHANGSTSRRSRTPTATSGRPSSRTREEQLGVVWDDIHQHAAFELGPKRSS